MSVEEFPPRKCLGVLSSCRLLFIRVATLSILRGGKKGIPFLRVQGMSGYLPAAVVGCLFCVCVCVLFFIFYTYSLHLKDIKEFVVYITRYFVCCILGGHVYLLFLFVQ